MTDVTRDFADLATRLPSLSIAKRNNGLPTFLGIPTTSKRTTAIVGKSEYSAKLEKVLDKRSKQIRGPFLPELDDTSERSIESLLGHVRLGKIQVVYLAPEDPTSEWVVSLLNRLGDSTVSIYLVASPERCPFDENRWHTVEGIPILCIIEDPTLGYYNLLKRLEDLLLGTIALLMIMPTILSIAIIIKLTSHGPTLFKQSRYGHNGKKFLILKFRTMSVAEDGDNVTQATKYDARVTRIGSFLRRTYFDELPQFFQVLSGEMSIVGPRPHAIAHNEQYRKLIENYMQRHKVKPGITGWAQLNGWVGETDTDEKMLQRVNHDLHYIRNWSITLDLMIIIRRLLGRQKVHRNAY